MARKPKNHTWPDVTSEQGTLLDDIDFYGNNGWDRNGQSEVLMPRLLAECAQAGLSLKQIKIAMDSIGYDKSSVHQLDRWDSKR
ncbi:MAG: hypothetical protein Q4P23_16090, partial [Micrococcaceae bacterium]|nr:hypothetical protein [Micrococcaceae bacterium]